MFLKELMLIRQADQKSFDIAILNIIGSDYGCIINGISKNLGMSLMQNADLTDKNGTL